MVGAVARRVDGNEGPPTANNLIRHGRELGFLRFSPHIMLVWKDVEPFFEFFNRYRMSVDRDLAYSPDYGGIAAMVFVIMCQGHLVNVKLGNQLPDDFPGVPLPGIYQRSVQIIKVRGHKALTDNRRMQFKPLDRPECFSYHLFHICLLIRFKSCPFSGSRLSCQGRIVFQNLVNSRQILNPAIKIDNPIDQEKHIRRGQPIDEFGF